jgi:hypothetical protein
MLVLSDLPQGLHESVVRPHDSIRAHLADEREGGAGVVA